MEKLATLTINDPSDDVMTSTPTTVTSQEPEAGDSDVSENSAASDDAAVTSPTDDDVTNTEVAELV